MGRESRYISSIYNIQYTYIIFVNRKSMAFLTKYPQYIDSFQQNYFKIGKPKISIRFLLHCNFIKLVWNEEKKAVNDQDWKRWEKRKEN